MSEPTPKEDTKTPDEKPTISRKDVSFNQAVKAQEAAKEARQLGGDPKALAACMDVKDELVIEHKGKTLTFYKPQVGSCYSMGLVAADKAWGKRFSSGYMDQMFTVYLAWKPERVTELLNEDKPHFKRLEDEIKRDLLVNNELTPEIIKQVLDWWMGHYTALFDSTEGEEPGKPQEATTSATSEEAAEIQPPTAG